MGITLSSCQTKKYPALDNKVTEHTDADYEKKHFDDFLVYKKATTKATSNVSQQDDFPWKNTVSEKVANDIVSQIEKTLTSIVDEYGHAPSHRVVFFTQVMFSPEVRSVYEKEQKLHLKEVIWKHFKATILDHKLVNEKDEAVHLPNDELTISLHNVTDDGNNLSSEFVLRASTLGSSEYLNLVGFVDIEVEIVVGYERKSIDKTDIGNTLEINHQKVEIVEFDENVIHIKLESERNFEIFLDGCNNNYSGTGVAETIYDKFRKNQGLDYEMFIEKYDEFGLDKVEASKNLNEVWIFSCDGYALKGVFFYHPAKTIKRRIRIPVNIKTTQGDN